MRPVLEKKPTLDWHRQSIEIDPKLTLSVPEAEMPVRSLHGALTPLVVADPGADGAGAALAAAGGEPAVMGGARYSEHERARAIQRGFTFVHQVATDQKYFSDNGDDLLWFYFTISANAADRDLRARALRLGRERARHWRKANPHVPADAVTADLIYSLVSGSYAADQMGVPDREIKAQLRRAVARLHGDGFSHVRSTYRTGTERRPGDVRYLRERECARRARVQHLQIAAGDEEPL